MPNNTLRDRLRDDLVHHPRNDSQDNVSLEPSPEVGSTLEDVYNSWQPMMDETMDGIGQQLPFSSEFPSMDTTVYAASVENMRMLHNCSGWDRLGIKLFSNFDSSDEADSILNNGAEEIVSASNSKPEETCNIHRKEIPRSVSFSNCESTQTVNSSTSESEDNDIIVVDDNFNHTGLLHNNSSPKPKQNIPKKRGRPRKNAGTDKDPDYLPPTEKVPTKPARPHPPEKSKTKCKQIQENKMLKRVIRQYKGNPWTIDKRLATPYSHLKKNTATDCKPNSGKFIDEVEPIKTTILISPKVMSKNSRTVRRGSKRKLSQAISEGERKIRKIESTSTTTSSLTNTGSTGRSTTVIQSNKSVRNLSESSASASSSGIRTTEPVKVRTSSLTNTSRTGGSTTVIQSNKSVRNLSESSASASSSGIRTTEPRTSSLTNTSRTGGSTTVIQSNKSVRNLSEFSASASSSGIRTTEPVKVIISSLTNISTTSRSTTVTQSDKLAESHLDLSASAPPRPRTIYKLLTPLTDSPINNSTTERSTTVTGSNELRTNNSKTKYVNRQQYDEEMERMLKGVLEVKPRNVNTQTSDISPHRNIQKATQKTGTARQVRPVSQRRSIIVRSLEAKTDTRTTVDNREILLSIPSPKADNNLLDNVAPMGQPLVLCKNGTVVSFPLVSPSTSCDNLWKKVPSTDVLSINSTTNRSVTFFPLVSSQSSSNSSLENVPSTPQLTSSSSTMNIVRGYSAALQQLTSSRSVLKEEYKRSTLINQISNVSKQCPSTERSPSHFTSRQVNEPKSHSTQSPQYEKLAKDRHIIYVGGINRGITYDQLRNRFEKFGKIIDINICLRRRKEKEDYAFITFESNLSAIAAKEHGNDGHDIKYNLGFGGRRQFCRSEWSDIDNPTSSTSVSKNSSSDLFEDTLKEFVKWRKSM